MKEQIQHQLDDGELEADHIETAGGRSLHDTAERDDTKRTLFWSFPAAGENAAVAPQTVGAAE